MITIIGTSSSLLEMDNSVVENDTAFMMLVVLFKVCLRILSSVWLIFYTQM